MMYLSSRLLSLSLSSLLYPFSCSLFSLLFDKKSKRKSSEPKKKKTEKKKKAALSLWCTRVSFSFFFFSELRVSCSLLFIIAIDLFFFFWQSLRRTQTHKYIYGHLYWQGTQRCCGAAGRRCRIGSTAADVQSPSFCAGTRRGIRGRQKATQKEEERRE